jgi:outer membrane protein OmpA-like peptidoglycan-associated protein
MKFVRIFTTFFIAVFLLSSCKSSSYLKKFHKEAKKEVGSATIRLRGDTVRVIYPELAMFDFGKDEIKPDAKVSLQRFATLLNKYDRINFTINGYTDNVGTNGVNQSLSQRRADNAKALFQQNGVSADRMMTNGRGADNPIRTNDTEEGRQANRRVELLLYERK